MIKEYLREQKSSRQSVKNSSNDKIQDLYMEFESLKSRISNSIKKKPFIILDETNNYKHSKSKAENSRHTSRQDSIITDIKTEDFNLKQSHSTQQNSKDLIYAKYQLRKIIEGIVKNKIEKIEKEYIQRFDILNKKLTVSLSAIQKLKTILSLNKKKNEYISQKIIFQLQNEDQEKDMPQSFMHLTQSYEQKIEKLTQSYEAKLSLLIRQQNEKDRQTRSSTVKNAYDSLERNFEQEILLRETQINRLKIECSKLRRFNDQLGAKNEIDTALIKSLQEELQEKIGLIKRLKSNEGDEENKWKKQRQDFETIIEQNNRQIKKLIEQIIKQKASLAGQSQNQGGQLYKEERNNNKNQFFITELSGVEIEEEKDLELRRSMILQPKRKKSMAENYKKLEVQINLIAEENKLLKFRKDFFENQVKSSELDQQRYQQQGTIYKAELKRLNEHLLCLDQLASEYLKDSYINSDKLALLDDNLKSKVILKQILRQKQKSKHNK